MKAPFNPLLRIVSERGARHDRIWGEARPHLGGGTTERGAAFADRHRLRIALSANQWSLQNQAGSHIIH
ncbi:MAG: hypothetical protein EGQ96_01455 [Prevotella sp.]|nr:hypothetical protein [Prevotella sp.]